MSLIRLESFAQYEIPEPLTYTFQDADGAAIDLSSDFDAVFHLKVGTADAVELAATITNEAGGVVTYTWEADDLDGFGLLRANFVVDNGTNRFESVPIIGYVRPALFTAAS